jgi:hypothetical protein
VGFGRKLVRKTTRKAVPRSVRHAAHPVHTATRAVTPKPIRQASHAVYTITNPLGATEDNLLRSSSRSGGRGHTSGGASQVFSQRETVSARQASRGTDQVGGVRAAEAMSMHDHLAQLMAVQRERFSQAQPPVVPPAATVDAAPLQLEEWKKRKGQAHFWQPAKRSQLRDEANQVGLARASEATVRAANEAHRQQEAATAWWKALVLGEPDVLGAALQAAFADNPAPVTVVRAEGTKAVLRLILPGTDVLPEKQAHITPTGKLSAKAWTKTDLNETYAQLLGAHLLATIRETWAIAPSVTDVRLLGTREKPADDSPHVLFDVDVSRGERIWTDDEAGAAVLEHAPWGLVRTGGAKEVQPWQVRRLRPDVVSLFTGSRA